VADRHLIWYKGTMGSATQRRARDLVLIHGVDRTRSELHVLRSREEQVEAGVVRAVEDGRPVYGDIVRLKPRPEFPLLCDVEEVLAHPDRETGAAAPGHGGPPRVSSDAFRRGWEAIFGPERTDDLTN
jgi:hypothetical protein